MAWVLAANCWTHDIYNRFIRSCTSESEVPQIPPISIFFARLKNKHYCTRRSFISLAIVLKIACNSLESGV